MSSESFFQRIFLFLLHSSVTTFRFCKLKKIAKMSSDKMEVELAEQKMNSMEHSEQHYFKRYVWSATLLAERIEANVIV